MAVTPVRALPGPLVVPVLPEDARGLAVALSLQCCQHRFDVLGSGPVRVACDTPARRRQLAGLAVDFAPLAVAAYAPIDWHADFKAGYRWDPCQHYLDVRVAPAAGVDIKVPRELSRFHHVGALALGGRDDAAQEFTLQVLDWIAANLARRGVNWACTMDVAIRAVNWIWGLRFFHDALCRWPRAALEILRSLREHGLHIQDNLEYCEEGGGNHYLSNVAGLLYIGAACPEFPESDRWVLFALQELVSEMRRQVYPDGASYEASTHYHRLVAETFFSCAALAERLTPERRERLRRADIRGHRIEPRLRPFATEGVDLAPGARVLPQPFYDRLALMAGFTAALTKPNGLVPQIGDNDSARLHKLCPIPADDPRDHRHLLAVAGELFGLADFDRFGAAFSAEAALVAGGLRGRVRVETPPSASPIRWFRDAGVVVITNDRFHLTITCGPNGQNGRGGHGHNDKLSFELNADGSDFIVDGGCPLYTPDPSLRNQFRSTHAHNTVAVEGVEQDSLPGGLPGLFRLPERCGRRFLEVGQRRVIGEHSGFGATHRRTWQMFERRIVILDELDSDARRTIVLNLDPSVTCMAIAAVRPGTTRVELTHAAGARLLVTFEGVGAVSREAGFFSKGYGRQIGNQRLLARMDRACATTTIESTEAHNAA
jgi:hypothetical protein